MKREKLYALVTIYGAMIEELRIYNDLDELKNEFLEILKIDYNISGQDALDYYEDGCFGYKDMEIHIYDRVKDNRINLNSLNFIRE